MAHFGPLERVTRARTHDNVQDQMRPDSCGVETRRGSRTLATLSTAP